MTDTYVAIDLETTGLDPKKEKIIEIGAVKVVDGQVAEEFATLVDPRRLLEERISELTGITDAELSGAPYIDEVIGPAAEFIGDLPLLGHRILFDYSFFRGLRGTSSAGSRRRLSRSRWYIKPKRTSRPQKGKKSTCMI